jgi:hypothetical protein
MTAGLVALMAALAGAAWIDVPFTRQEKNGCGSASVWMLMEYWGKSPEPPEVIHSLLYSKEGGGVFASDMERFLSARGFRTFAFAGQWSDLTENVAKGRPLVVSIEASSKGAPLHYVLVVGVDEARQIVLVNDPAQRKLLPMARSDFEQRWDAMNRWTLLALPEGPADPAPRVRPVLPSSSAPDPVLDQASNAFREGDLDAARRALRRGGESPLRNEFLATVFFLEDNLEAALRYWNRNGSPQLREVHMDFETRWDPILLDRTVGISRATVLRDSDYVLARKRLEASQAFSGYRFDLSPVENGDNEFDLNLRAAEKSTWNPAAWVIGLPYRTVTPEFRNIGGGGINLDSLWRWDSQKRRLAGTVSGPVSASSRFEAGIDARSETWEIDGTTIPVKRQELRLGLNTVANHRWTWSSGTVFVRRPSGSTLKYAGSTRYDLLRVPERRFTLTTEIRGDAGRRLSSTERMARAEAGLYADWLPRPSGDGYGVSIRARTGRVWGSAPADELFALGVDRDGDLWLRGHSTTRNGRKGFGIIARRYALLNAEVSKTLFHKGLFRAGIVPFLDFARAGAVFADAGAEFRLTVASLATFSLSVGRDLKDGRTVVFTHSRR